MLAFEVSVNGKTVCIAGFDDYGVLSAILTWVRRRPDVEFQPGSEELEFTVGGLISGSTNSEENLDWLKQELRVGDDVRIRVIESDRADEPAKRRRDDPKRREQRQRAYYEQMK